MKSENNKFLGNEWSWKSIPSILSIVPSIRSIVPSILSIFTIDNANRDSLSLTNV